MYPFVCLARHLLQQVAGVLLPTPVSLTNELLENYGLVCLTKDGAYLTRLPDGDVARVALYLSVPRARDSKLTSHVILCESCIFAALYQRFLLQANTSFALSPAS